MERWSAVDGALASRGNHGDSNKIQQSEDYSLGVTHPVLNYGVSANRTEPQSLALTRRVLAFSQRLSPKGSDTKTSGSRSLGSLLAQQRLRPVRLACGLSEGVAVQHLGQLRSAGRERREEPSHVRLPLIGWTSGAFIKLC